MATKKQRTQAARAAASARWAGKTPEERREMMRLVGSKGGRKPSAERCPCGKYPKGSKRRHACAPAFHVSEIATWGVDLAAPGDFGQTVIACARCFAPLEHVAGRLVAPCAVCAAGVREFLGDALNAPPVPAPAPDPVAAAQAAPVIEATRELRESLAAQTPAAPIAAPGPRLVAYGPDDACSTCGRMPDLHQEHGGPLGHNHTRLQIARAPA